MSPDSEPVEGSDLRERRAAAWSWIVVALLLVPIVGLMLLRLWMLSH